MEIVYYEKNIKCKQLFTYRFKSMKKALAERAVILDQKEMLDDFNKHSFPKE